MASLITSLQNVRLKSLSKLRDTKHRKREKRFLVDGQREIRQAIQGGIEIEEVWYDPERVDWEEWCQRELGQSTLRVDSQPATAEVLTRLEYGDRSEGMVAVARTPPLRLSDLKLKAAPLIVVLDGVEKPGNVGAVCRTAAAAEVAAIILSDCRCEPFNPNAIRASLGLVFHVPVAVASAQETISFLNQHRVAIFAARVQAADSPYRLDLSAGTALVLGSEAEGLGGAWLDGKIRGIRIPMADIVDSLNVSVSAAILVYEAVRQRSLTR